MLHSSGRAAVYLSFGTVEADSTARFHVQELWQIQEVLDAFNVHSAVLHIEILLFQFPIKEKRSHKRKKARKKKRDKQLPGRPTAPAVPVPGLLWLLCGIKS
jgi:hypothetical protein